MSSVDAMAARLASSLAIAEGKRQVDLRPKQGKGLRQANVFLVGKLLTARDFKVQSFMGMFRNAWRVNGSLQVEEAEEQRVLFTLSDPSDRVRIWRGAPWGYNHAPVALALYDGIMPVEKVPLAMASYWITLLGIPPAFRSERVMTMIGYTLGDFQEIDKTAKKTGKLRIRVEIPLHKPLPFKRWYLVEDAIEFRCQFRYDKLFGRCSVCGLVTHVGLPCSGPALDEDDDEAERTVLGSQNTVSERSGGGSQGGWAGSTSGHASGSGLNTGGRARATTPCPPLIFRTPDPGPSGEPCLNALFPKQKRHIVVRELQGPAVTPERITGKRRAREESMTISPKKLKLSLAVGKRNLTLDSGNLGLDPIQEATHFGSMKRKRGRPSGSRNKVSSDGKQQTSKHGEGKAKNKSPTKKQSVGKHSNPKGTELALF